MRYLKSSHFQAFKQKWESGSVSLAFPWDEIQLQSRKDAFVSQFYSVLSLSHCLWPWEKGHHEEGAGGGRGAGDSPYVHQLHRCLLPPNGC